MPLATKNNALIVKDGKIAENCECCETTYVCLCNTCVMPDSLRVSVTALTSEIYNYVVCARKPPGQPPQNYLSYAYRICAPSGVLSVPKVGGNASSSVYQATDAISGLSVGASLNYSISTDRTFLRVSIGAYPLLRFRNVLGSTPPTRESLDPAAGWNDCKSSSKTAFDFSGSVAFLMACDSSFDPLVNVDETCSAGEGSRSFYSVPGASPLSLASTAFGQVPPITLRASVPVFLIGPSGAPDGAIRLTNVESWAEQNFNFAFGLGTMLMIDTSIPQSLFPNNLFYGTPTIWHAVEFSVDSIEAVYGSSLVPLFANNGRPPLTF
jgi:hypothetical protein